MSATCNTYLNPRPLTQTDHQYSLSLLLGWYKTFPFLYHRKNAPYPYDCNNSSCYCNHQYFCAESFSDFDLPLIQSDYNVSVIITVNENHLQPTLVRFSEIASKMPRDKDESGRLQIYFYHSLYTLTNWLIKL